MAYLVVKGRHDEGSGRNEAGIDTALFEVCISFQDFICCGNSCVKRYSCSRLHEFIRSKTCHGCFHVGKAVENAMRVGAMGGGTRSDILPLFS